MEILNRKASFNYYIEDTYEAGIVLKGTEIKSIRAGKCNIKDSYVIIKKWEIVLNIPIICTHTTRNQLYLFFVLQNLASLDSVLQDFCHGLMSLMQLFCQVVCMVFIIFNVGRCKSFPLRARSRYVRNVAVLSSQPFVLALAIRPSAH